jgi:hypothetical protein
MVLSGLTAMLYPTPKALSSDRPENTPSSLFSGAVNTISQNHPIQICYGELEVGSAIIATMIDNSEGYIPGSSGKYSSEEGDPDGDRQDRRYGYDVIEEDEAEVVRR